MLWAQEKIKSGWNLAGKRREKEKDRKEEMDKGEENNWLGAEK